jgi:hypothetical protein
LLTGSGVPRLFSLAFIFLLIFTAQPVLAAEEIPFDFRAGMIRLKVNVAGQSKALDFLLDSGAGKSVLHLGSARRIGLKLGRQEIVQGVQGSCDAYRVAVTGTVGTAVIPRDILALDLSSISAHCGGPIDGLLGADFFRDRIVQIDFRARRVRLLQRQEMPTASGEIVPLVRRHDALCVSASVDGNDPQWMRLDTGCSGALEWVMPGKQTRRRIGTSMAAATGSRTHIQTEVVLGTERIAGVKTGLHPRPLFAGESGLIGNGLLARFRVTVDAAKKQLLLER